MTYPRKFRNQVVRAEASYRRACSIVDAVKARMDAASFEERQAFFAALERGFTAMVTSHEALTRMLDAVEELGVESGHTEELLLVFDAAADAVSESSKALVSLAGLQELCSARRE